MENNEENKFIENVNNENIEQATEKQDIKTEDTTGENNNGECWALVCYNEKTLFQRITYSLKKIMKYTKDRVLGKI